MINVADTIEKKKLITIVRRTYGEDLLKLAGALYEGGVRLMEVTFDQADPDCLNKTGDAIRMLHKEMPRDMFFGAGTVLTIEQTETAFAAGACFIISPNTDVQVIRRTKELGAVSIPGAMTPSEMMIAHNAGADFIKVFPADLLGGAPYMKAVLAPLSHLKLLATSGVSLEYFEEYLKVGITGAGVSGALTDKTIIAAGNWDEFTRRAQAFCRIAEKYS